MDLLQAYKRRTQVVAFVVLVICGGLMLGAERLGRHFMPNSPVLSYVALIVFGLVLAYILSKAFIRYATEPLEFVWRAIVHVSPSNNSVAAPNLDQNTVAHELVTSLVLQVYQLASQSDDLKPNKQTSAGQITQTIASNFPLPVIAIDNKQAIIFINDAALKYLNTTSMDVLHKNLYSVLDLAFSDDKTLDTWLQDSRQNKATDTSSWQRVRLTLNDQETLRQFDMAAAYSKENPAGAEVIMTLFDQTARYHTDDQALDFIAVAVHELRTPLTALRGYIEVFEDELSDKLDPELTEFMHKMQASAQQLTAFVNNILKVARVEEGQLSLQLTEENWGSIVKEAIDNLKVPAQVHGITIEYNVAAGLPTVGVDKITITEVINNLLDNAIKYSQKGQTVTVRSGINQDGMVETTVTDQGVGIPSSVMPHLFEKFRRNHRNQAKIGGTGLGLYLCSALVKAHGGNIWVQSKEGEGTTLSFTIQPYQQLADNVKDGHNKDIIRNAHGWIKNHSMYRR